VLVRGFGRFVTHAPKGKVHENRRQREAGASNSFPARGNPYPSLAMGPQALSGPHRKCQAKLTAHLPAVNPREIRRNHFQKSPGNSVRRYRMPLTIDDAGGNALGASRK
jgi:hypothetical protein